MVRIDLTNEELKVITDWQNARSAQYMLDESQENVDIVIPLARSYGSGRINFPSLDAAIASSFRSLKYMPGQEHPVIKAELAKVAAAKAQAAAHKAQQEKDAAELERKRKRDAQIKAGHSNQSQIKTEFDRFEESQKPVKEAKEAAEKAAHTKQVEDAAREQVEEIRSSYLVSHNGQQTNWAHTQERRDLLKKTRVSTKDGKTLWVETLKLLRDCLHAFEIEDSKRGG